MTAQPPPYTIPIADRPHKASRLRVAVAGLFFALGCLSVNATHFVLCTPLWFVSSKWYRASIGWTKRCFGTLLVVMCQFFAPSKFVITTEGMNEEEVFVRDADGRVVGLDLPQKLVIISNHQIYLDWWYLWVLTYFMNFHASVLIILKASLKWVPILGWGMQFFEFIFLARSWEADRANLAKHLKRIGQRAQKDSDPLTLIIYPEGTLVSKDTRPLSKKYADKQGIDDMVNCLLPRSTGLQYALRTLSPYVPDLHVLDMTVGYPGIPPAGYGQSWYTLRSVFLDGVPPPAVHLHLRLYQVRRDIPVGEVGAGETLASTEEKKVFEDWLVERWREKDRLLSGFYDEGRFFSGEKKPVGSSAGAGAENEKVVDASRGTEVPMQVRSVVHVLDAMCWFVPGLAVSGLRRMWTGRT